MDHCYAAPPQTSFKLSETDSDYDIIEEEGGWGEDSAPVTATAAVRSKVKKVAGARPSLPLKPVKWKQRDYNQ